MMECLTGGSGFVGSMTLFSILEIIILAIIVVMRIEYTIPNLRKLWSY